MFTTVIVLRWKFAAAEYKVPTVGQQVNVCHRAKENPMTNQRKYWASIFRNSRRQTNFELMLLCALTIVALPTAQAQTFSVIHNFSGQDGATPYAGLTMDKAGNFYG